MNLIDEHDGARAVLTGALGIGHHLLDFLDAGKHCRKLHELRVRHARNDVRERGLSDSGRPPENQRTGIIALDLDA